MASAFKNYYTNSIGTSNTSIFTGPSGAQTTVIGMTLTNIEAQPIDVTLFLSIGGANTYIVKGATVPKGSALVPVGGDQKLVVEAGDVLYVYSNTASSVDVVVSTLEIT
jgi:hypothetical protein